MHVDEGTVLVGDATVLVSVGTVQVDGATLRVDGTTVCGRRLCRMWTSLVAKWVLVHWLSLQGVRTVTTAGKKSSWLVKLLQKLYIVKNRGPAKYIYKGRQICETIVDHK